ncbi:MAG: Rrf2 family transcriptional regulator [Phycisphaeraceae bacterium]|nr:Rrf2 family transcriptional regulator [Phycisphaeraceae bacterium]
MLSLNRKTDYALIALAHLAKEATDADETVSARAIAEFYDLPSSLLGNILKDLARARLVDSTRGANGGYRLATDPQRISLLEVVTAIEGPVQFSECAGGLPIAGQGCDVERCPIRGPVQQLHHRMNEFLDAVRLADLLADDQACVDPNLCDEPQPSPTRAAVAANVES